jgi:hypothetical protein
LTASGSPGSRARSPINDSSSSRWPTGFTLARSWRVHKREHESDDPDLIGRTRRYIERFSAAFDKAATSTELYESMVALYPSRVNLARALELGQVRLRLTVQNRHIAGHTANRSACRRWARLAGSATLPHRSGQRQPVPS